MANGVWTSVRCRYRLVTDWRGGPPLPRSESHRATRRRSSPPLPRSATAGAAQRWLPRDQRARRRRSEAARVGVGPSRRRAVRAWGEADRGARPMPSDPTAAARACTAPRTRRRGAARRAVSHARRSGPGRAAGVPPAGLQARPQGVGGPGWCGSRRPVARLPTSKARHGGRTRSPERSPGAERGSTHRSPATTHRRARPPTHQPHSDQPVEASLAASIARRAESRGRPLSIESLWVRTPFAGGGITTAFPARKQRTATVASDDCSPVPLLSQAALRPIFAGDSSARHRG